MTLNYINQYAKEDVYQAYVAIVEQYKPYERITKVKMIKEMISVYLSDTDVLFSMLTIEDINILKNLIKDPKRCEKYEHGELRDLVISGIIYPSFIYYEVIPELKPFIEAFEIDEEFEILSEFYYFIKGLLFVRGYIHENDARSIYESTTHYDFNYDYLIGNMNKCRLLFDIVTYDIQEIIVSLCVYDYDVNVVTPSAFSDDQYSLDDYKCFGKFGINIEDPDLSDLFDMFNRLKANHLLCLDDIQKWMQKEGDIDFLRRYNYSEAFDLFAEKVLYLWPRWSLGGYSLQMLELLDDDYNDPNLKCACGSDKHPKVCCENQTVLLNHHAIQTERLKFQFYELFYELLFMTNQMYKVLPVELSMTEFLGTADEESLHELSGYLFQENEVLNGLDDIKLLDDTTNDIVNGLQSHIKIVQGVAIDFYDQKLVVFDEKNQCNYMISGIFDPLSTKFPSEKLPTYVSFEAIPLEESIIYDVFILEDKSNKITLKKEVDIRRKSIDLPYIRDRESLIKHHKTNKK